MTDLSKKKAVIVDNGLFAELARVMAREYEEVFYYCPWEDAFPLINDTFIGYGVENITLIDSPFKVLDEIQIAVFPDIYFGAMQEYLEGQGIRVWGSRLGEELEIDRVRTKELMAKKVLPVGKYEVVKGMDALRVFLKDHKNQYVKLADGRFRGHFETFKAENYNLIEPRLDEIQTQFGPFKNIIEFVVEEQLPDKVEIGVDCYCIDGQFPEKTLYGVEIKGTSYVGAMGEWSKMPPELTDWGNSMSGLLKAYRYRNFLSSEYRIGKDRVSYMIDACCRMPTPPSEGSQEWYENINEIIWEGAAGKMVQPKIKSKFLAEIIIHSDWSENHPQPVEYPKQYRDNIKLRNAVRVDRKWYTLPQKAGTLIGGISGFGDTIKEACDMAIEIAGSVRGYGLDISLDSLNAAEEEWEKTMEIIK
jgi:hypothetical protein